MPARRIERIVLTLIVVLGIGLRAWGLRFGLPDDFARPDEEKIVGPALAMLRGDLNPHLFLYPSFFTYITACAYAIQFGAERISGMTSALDDFVAQATVDPSTALLLARWLAAAAGVGTILVLYGAVREWLSERAALIAAAFCAVAFLHVRDSHFGVTDVPVTFLTVCAFWAGVRCATRGVTTKRVALAGVIAGLAASTKYNAALILLPLVIVLGTDATLLKRGWLHLGGAVALLGTCAALAFLVGTPYALLDRATFLHDFSVQERTALGTFHTIILDAARRAVGERGWIHHFTFTLRYGVGIPLLVAAIAGTGWLAVTRPRTAIIALSFPVAFYIVMGASQLVYARWLVPTVPFVCLAAAVFVDTVVDAVARLFGTW